MSRYCTVCGRELTKSEGPIGPKCLQKLKPRNIRAPRARKAHYGKIAAKYDMYGGENGQEEDDRTGDVTEEQEISKNG